MKKIVALLLTFIMLFSNTGAVLGETHLVHAEQLTKITESEIVYINPLYKDVISESDLKKSQEPAISTFDLERKYEPPSWTESCSTIEEAGAMLRDHIKERTETVTIYYKTTEAITSDLLLGIIDEAMKHTGIPTEGDYIKFQYGGAVINAYDVIGRANYYRIVYKNTYYTSSEQEAEVDAKVETVLKSLNLSDQNNYVKIKTIYDYICQNVTYDFENLENEEYRLQYTAYGALIDKTAVCQGYAVLLYRLLLECGVDCRIIAGVSYGVPHGWNIVQINEKYYNVDSTWDAGSTDYSYFLRGNKNFSGHVRDVEYNTEEFNALYPMTETDYNLLMMGNGKWSSCIAKSFGAGDGSAESPYLISKPEELALLAYYVNTGTTPYNKMHYQLTDDIDLSENEWIPIGIGCDINDEPRWFMGTFDGAGYSISGMKVLSATKNGAYYGLFGAVNGGTIENLEVKDAKIKLTSLFADMIYVGGIAGICENAVIENVDFCGEINIGNYDKTLFNVCVGGLSGSFSSDEKARITNCYAMADIIVETEGSATIGGVAGGLVNKSSEDILIENTYSNSTLTQNSVSEYKFSGTDKFDAVSIQNCGIFRYDRFYHLETVKSETEGKIFSINIFNLKEASISELFGNTFGYDKTVWNIKEDYYPTLVHSAEAAFPEVFDYKTVSGSCGTDMTWEYSENGVLRICGNGEMNHYENAKVTPWYIYKDNIYEVYIEKGVNRLDDNAFYGYSNLNEIYFYGNTPIIGQDAFGLVTANVYYFDSSEWTEADMKGYGGTLSWISLSHNHEYGEWTVITPASYISVGLEKRVCRQCVQEEIREIKVLIFEGLKYIDVMKTDWFYDATEYTYKHDLMTGKSETVFAPDESLARAQFASILYRTSGEPTVEYRVEFSDVEEAIWYTAPILWAKKAGIVNGYADGRFGPGDNITREQMAVMMYNYAVYCGYDVSACSNLSAFEDAESVSEYALEEMQWAVGSGIISGKSNGTILDPQGETARAQCAVMIQKFMENYTFL